MQDMLKCSSYFQFLQEGSKREVKYVAVIQCAPGMQTLVMTLAVFLGCACPAFLCDFLQFASHRSPSLSP